MRFRLSALLLVSLLTLSPALVAQEGSAPPPAAPPTAADAANAELKALNAAYKTAYSEYRKASAEYRAKKLENPRAELPPVVNPGVEYVGKYRDAAKRHAGSEASASMLIRAFELAYRGDPALTGEILDELLDGHMQSDRLTGIAFELTLGVYYLGADTARGVMTRIIDESPHDSVKTAFLHARGSLVNRSSKPTAEDRKRALADLDRAIKLGADTTYGKRAKAVKFELQHLQVGQPAPEIEGNDLDGVAFKLSDYRGKVVVLDFWGDW